ncbi:DNA ligase D [Pararhizobium mangrovi]|uniref:DNA ligase (ATP) n=1 Tax=Pararhizobium mangrovi TaxID=2590452 RepID=A0A506U3B9_9HYPH|nr:DNA ligase D [Pararhizobium mangrovi]TPW27039.1 DNA ligase D [Pararhizobium mangrovi]
MAGKADPLAEYKRRRDFSQTREPKGKAGRKPPVKERLAFLVQKHDATRLHYDFRLENEGVLLSWAVTKGPSADPEDKRLAVRTEDHPLEYGTFEGTIPKGQYGGGTVMLWDTGWWEPLHDPAEGIAEGKLHFILHGARMTGGWALVRMRARKGEKRENWLLVKERDDDARDDGDALLSENEKSVASDRTMKEIAEEKGETAQGKRVKTAKRTASTRSGKRAKSSGPPRFQKPQLATLYDTAPEGADWLHEVKFDGYRVLAAVGGGKTRFFTRNGHDWSDKFAVLQAPFAEIGCDAALVDGEVTAASKTDNSDFSALQKVLKSGADLTFHAFDLLSLDGDDWRDSPQIERKERLRSLLSDLPKGSALHYSDHVRGHGPEVHTRVCKAGEEGIVSKRADAPYRGERSKNWRKVKCTKRQEFVIGGYSPSDKKARPFASLLVGTHEDGALIYRGRVGTGFDQDLLDALSARFEKLARKTMPFESVPKERAKDARWLTPSLVAEIEFTEFTDDGHVRHGAFIGLREDKEASDVTLESRPSPSRKKAASSRKKTGEAKKEKTPSTAEKLERAEGESGDRILGVRISHPDRTLFEEQGVAKIDLARYYAVVAERMLAHAARRPLSLVRCPQGPQKACFFQKHASEGFPEAIRTVPIAEKSGEKQDYLYVEDGSGLVSCVQMGTLEFHVWGSSIDNLEKPERMIFDLDPDEGLGFAKVREAAWDMRARLSDLGLQSVVMATGGKGLHVIVPIERRAGWDRIKAFARGFATVMASEDPERYTATMSKEKRKGRIFVDWLRNERGATAITPYSTRSRPGAPVATPLAWEELDDLEAGNTFTVRTVIDRLDDEPWPQPPRQSVTKAMEKAVTR